MRPTEHTDFSQWEEWDRAHKRPVVTSMVHVPFNSNVRGCLACLYRSFKRGSQSATRNMSLS